MICSPVCVHAGKVYRINASIVGRSKEDKKLTLLTYMCTRECIYVCDRKYGPFVFLSPHVCFFMTFGDNVSRSSSRQKNVTCFFALSPVCDVLLPSVVLPLSVWQWNASVN